MTRPGITRARCATTEQKLGAPFAIPQTDHHARGRLRSRYRKRRCEDLCKELNVGNGRHSTSVPGAPRSGYAAGMERIWAPWRLEFVKAASGHDPLECVFCAAPGDPDDQKQLILHRGPTCFVILNLYPYTNGHILIAPYRHLASPGEMDAVERAELWELLDRSLEVLDRTLKPHGANAGLNLGRTAGAGIEGHIHLHVVPRWNGDTNFMPVLADTRVMAQHLDDTWRLLRDAWVPSQA